MSMDYKKAEWGRLVANADLQIAAGTCPLIEDEAVVWADQRIQSLEKALLDIMRHQKIIAGGIYEKTGAWNIANETLKKAH